MEDIGLDEHTRESQICIMTEHRPVQGPEYGQVVEVTEAGGLYGHYERIAA